MSRYIVNTLNRKGKISREIYGHFSEHLGRCIYGGLFVGKNSSIPNTNGMRNDVVNALRKIKIPVLRWPGGCFADEYHWKDGVGPAEKRKKMINTHWGGVLEDNSFGTHEYLELCRQLNCAPYICGNVGSGTVRELSEWIEYINFDGVSPMSEWRKQNGRAEPWNLKYLGVGNESWGCGGNMTAEYYSNEYRRYQTYARNYGGRKLFKIACGPSGDDTRWTEVMMKNAADFMDGLSLHYYTVPGDSWEQKGAATVFDDSAYYKTVKKALDIDRIIKGHTAVMDRYDPEKRVALIVDEWGTWYDVEFGTNPGFLYQQNTMRDALVAGLTLNIFNKHCDRVKMANIAQMVNVLQAVILTDGANMLLTPTYHIYDLYSVHQDSELVESYMEPSEAGVEDQCAPGLSESASVSADGSVHITLCNLSLTDARKVEATVVGKKINGVDGAILENEIHAHNTFETPDTVTPAAFTGVKADASGFTAEIPAHSIVRITLS